MGVIGRGVTECEGRCGSIRIGKRIRTVRVRVLQMWELKIWSGAVISLLHC